MKTCGRSGLTSEEQHNTTFARDTGREIKEKKKKKGEKPIHKTNMEIEEGAVTKAWTAVLPRGFPPRHSFGC